MDHIQMVDYVRQQLLELTEQTEQAIVSTDFILYRVDWLLERIGQVSALTNSAFPQEFVSALESVRQAIQLEMSTAAEGGTAYRSQTRDVHTGPGRPAIPISINVICKYLELRIPVTKIALALRVSEKTIWRRMRDHDIRISDFYVDMTDAELDKIICDIQHMFPNCGYKMVKGHLNGLGLRIQTLRVQRSMRRNDPQGVMERSLSLHTVRRRCYSVPAPNSLWHIDGNHKLIRWRIVIHGGIDGFSRLVVYLGASTNNRAETVLNLFKHAVRNYGIPSRVRSDKGVENRDVATFMVHHRGTDRNSHIAGRSVHNQRIERLWRDVYICVLDVFHSIFSCLENMGLLHPDNELHLYALHWVFIPVIQSHLDFFVQGWNNHSIRTARNMSPLQMWHVFRNSEDLMQVSEEYGTDWSGPSAAGVDTHLDIPEIELPRQLTEADFALLPQPSTEQRDYGVQLYCETVEVLSRLL
uniref:Integrase catalytic domain-containing protein n=1 Tax=Cyprinus carpio carpio TaxID=630221 RepID=A0A9J7X8B1_CYPCA